MFEIVIFFLVLMFIFGMAKPNAMKTENPFTGPKFSWKLAFVFALVITAIAGGVLYVGVPYLNKNKKIKGGGGKSEGETGRDDTTPGGKENKNTPPDSSIVSDNTLQLKQFSL